MSQTPQQPPPPPYVDYASPGAGPPRAGRRFFQGLFGWVLFIGLAVMLFIVLQSNKTASVEVPLSSFLGDLAAGNFKEVVVDGETLRGWLSTPRPIGNATGVTRIRAELPPTTSQSWAFIQWLNDNRQGATIRVENNQNLMVNLLLPVIPWLLIFAFIWFFIFRQLRAAGRQQQQQQQEEPKPVPVYLVNPEQK
jgi:cell division protease FtsH